MSPSPPHKRARTSSPPPPSDGPSAPTPHDPPMPSRNDISSLPEQMRTDLILTLLERHPAEIAVVKAALDQQAADVRAEVIAAEALPMQIAPPAPIDFGYHLASLKPRLRMYIPWRRVHNHELGDKIADSIKKDIEYAVAEMLAGCKVSPNPQTRYSALTTALDIAKYVINTQNAQIKAQAETLGRLLAETMIDILNDVTLLEEGSALKKDMEARVEEVSQLYERAYGDSDTFGCIHDHFSWW